MAFLVACAECIFPVSLSLCRQQVAFFKLVFLSIGVNREQIPCVPERIRLGLRRFFLPGGRRLERRRERPVHLGYLRAYTRSCRQRRDRGRGRGPLPSRSRR